MVTALVGFAALSVMPAGAASARSSLVHAACKHRITVANAGTLTSRELTETSGLVASRAHPGVLWAHNDSGDRARSSPWVSTGPTSGRGPSRPSRPRDWEDIALGPGPTSGSWSLYLGDIGDNNHDRASIEVVRVPEPDPSAATRVTAPPAVLTLTYPDGPHDAEALLVDPDDGTVVIVTKVLVGPASVYTTGPLAPDAFGGTAALRRAGRVRLGLIAPVTAGDVSPDGRTVALRSYGDVHLMTRRRGASMPRTLRAKRCSVATSSEPQGEALALLDGGYFTTSEGIGAVLHHGTIRATIRTN